MSDITHLLIPYAASASEGAQQALAGMALPHLDRLLARLSPAGTHPGEETSFSTPHERALAQALGLPHEDGRIPWAAWHRHQQGLPTDGQAWAFLTPCQWQVGADHVTLRDPDHLMLDEAASRALLAIVAPWFAEDGIALHYDQPTRWLAQGEVFNGLATASLERVLLRDVRPWMPDVRAARTLHRLHSEMQMLLYTHAFNDERAARGLPVVNAFWVHGTGALPTPAPTPTTAAAAAAPTVAHQLRDAALREDWRAWATAWAALDAGPVADLLRQAESGTPVRLTLSGERNALGFHSAPRGLGQRIQSLFRPQRFSSLREQL
ncbi:phosphoglycerate mutase [Diaphorobacter sp.]|uniref:phosphoglycerate mutase n=1 Tax=Diaphorobacter sp. TaxID=1934310 RepID=UPI003D14C691